ncbi:MAG: TSUP family transporter, partial [Chloroflexota bacterium]
MSIWDYLLLVLAAVAAGAVNALAGGGTLITFPTLVGLGLPPVVSSVTNTVALVPGYLGATFAQMNDMRGQKKRLWFLLPAGVIGGLLGGWLLLNTQEKLFRQLVPYLILLASGLLAVQDPVRGYLQRRAARNGGREIPEAWSA